LLHPTVELHLAKLEKETVNAGLGGSSEASGLKELIKLFDVVYRFTKGRR
jgi:hypothetical protein